MIKNPKVTVIIPCYNGFRYASECLDALSKQTFRDFKVIVIDDCSTDDSYEQFAQFSRQCSFELCVIRNDRNRGPGYSRHRGVQMATSEWIAFCDCDDAYDLHFLECMHSRAQETTSDLVMCDFSYVFSTGKQKEAQSLGYLNSNSDKRTILASAGMSLCTLFLRRSCFDGIEFPEIYHGEDAAVVPQLIANAQRVYVEKQSLYNYNVRNDSASNQFSEQTSNEFMLAFSTVEHALVDTYHNEVCNIGNNMVLYGVTLIMLKSKRSREDIISIIDEFEKKYPKWHKNLYFHTIRTSKRIYLWFLRYRLLNICCLYSRIHDALLGN